MLDQAKLNYFVILVIIISLFVILSEEIGLNISGKMIYDVVSDNRIKLGDFLHDIDDDYYFYVYTTTDDKLFLARYSPEVNAWIFTHFYVTDNNYIYSTKDPNFEAYVLRVKKNELPNNSISDNSIVLMDIRMNTKKKAV